MRKLIVFLFLLTASMVLCSEETQLKLYGGAGFGAGDCKNLNVTGGVELVLTGKISLMMEMDYFKDPDNSVRKEIHQSGNIVVLKDDTEAISLGGFCKYRISRLFFAKAGFIYRYHRKEYQEPEREYREIVKTRKAGVSAGIGLDLPLSKRLSSRFGVDVYDAGQSTWWKFYTNFCVRII